jgi:hypothetical protein
MSDDYRTDPSTGRRLCSRTTAVAPMTVVECERPAGHGGSHAAPRLVAGETLSPWQWHYCSDCGGAIVAGIRHEHAPAVIDVTGPYTNPE